MSIGSRIKERREEINITQEELARLLGVSKGAIGNYESGFSYPKIENMTKLFEVLKTDANYLFQDSINDMEEEKLTFNERQYIKKYRTLDEYGKEAVDNVLDVEHRRCLNDAKNDSDIDVQGKTRLVYKAARSTDGEKAGYVEMSEEEIQRIVNAPEADDF